MLNPLNVKEFSVPVTRMHADNVMIVLAVSDVDQWDVQAMSTAGIVSFTKGTVGQNGGASFRPVLTILKPGHTVVTLFHIADNRAYDIGITVPIPKDGTSLRWRGLDEELNNSSAGGGPSVTADPMGQALVYSESQLDEFDNNQEGGDIEQDDQFVSAWPRKTFVDHVGGFLRRLAGSNCVQIEYGLVSRYYTCVGCVIENAMGCVDDMRQNKSGNVNGACNMNYIREGNQKEDMEKAQQQACCPLFDGLGKLRFPQSAFNMALNCIKQAGCDGSRVYMDLMDECSHMCDRVTADKHKANQADNQADNGWYDDSLKLDLTRQDIVRSGDMYSKKGTRCLATFAAGPRGASVGFVLPLLLGTVATVFFLF